MSSHEHEHHHHPHGPLTNGGEPPAAARVRALVDLLVERGVVESRDVRQQVDWLVSRTPADGARLVARAWVDPAYKQRLLADGTAAVAELGFGAPQDAEIVVLENTPTVHNVVVCALCSCYPWAVLGLPPSWYKSYAYRSRVVREPRTVLREFGLELPQAVEIRVWDSNSDVRYMVLPERPAGTEPMSAAELTALVTRDAMIGVAKVQVSATVAGS